MGEEGDSSNSVVYIGLSVIAFFLLNKFINLVSPIYVFVVAGLLSVIGILMVGQPVVGFNSFFEEDAYWKIGGWSLFVGIIIFIIEISVPYNIVISFTGYTLPVGIRAFFGHVAERMFWGLVILIGFSVAVLVGWSYWDLFLSYNSNPPITKHNEMKEKREESKPQSEDDDYLLLHFDETDQYCDYPTNHYTNE